MKGIALFFVVLAVWWGSGPPVQAQRGDELALALRSNVVAIEAVWPGGQTREGFGFLIDVEGGAAYITAALHVLRSDSGASQRPAVSVRFYGRPGQATGGEVLDLAADQLDLGVITVIWPEHVTWQRDSLAPTNPNFGDPVWFIGRNTHWYVPASPGAFNRVSKIEHRVWVDNMPVRVGTFGAPLLSSNGIVGMVIRGSPADESIAVLISAIRAAFDEWNLPWGLLLTDQDPPYESGDLFNDCNDESSCPEVVVVPAGLFMVGSLEDEKSRDDDEGPRHRVTIPEPFAIGVYEVTFDEWDACVAAGGCNDYRPDDRGWGRDRRPVITVSWDDAQAYVAWLSGETDEAYQLPSEAEWEFAARAGTTTRYWPGDKITPEYANFFRNVGTIEVGSLGRPNAFGLHDVHGNVWEWVEDCWNDSYAGAPADGAAWTSGNCAQRVLRGGSWYYFANFLLSANRGRSEPDDRNIYTGFRVARTLR